MSYEIDSIRSIIETHSKFLMKENENKVVWTEEKELEPDLNLTLVTSKEIKKFLKERGHQTKGRPDDKEIKNSFLNLVVIHGSNKKKRKFNYVIRILYSYLLDTWIAVPVGIYTLSDDNWKRMMKYFGEDWYNLLSCYGFKLLNERKDWEELREDSKPCSIIKGLKQNS